MICARCMLRTLRSQSRHHARHYSTIQSLRAAQQSLTEHQATVSSPQGPSGAPSATSTSAAQPFSTPLSASPTAHGMDSKPKSQSPLVISSVPAGTPLKGLNFMKGKSDPLAMEDHEYPEWLWRILEDKKAAAETGTDGDIYSKSKTKRAKAIKRAKKAAALNPEAQGPKIPLYEQSVDLPFGDGTVQGAVEAANARDELTKAMRVKRRSGIKEANFLRTMR